MSEDTKAGVDILTALLGLNQPVDYSEVSIENYRVHLIYDEIDEFSAKDACEFLLKSYLEDPDSPVTLIVNSIGGSCDDGFAIIDLMEALPMKVRTIAIGQIMSMGFLIFTAGTKGERYIAPNACFMSHQFSNTIGGKDFEVEAAMKVQKMTRENITSHLQKYTGLSKTDVQKKLLPQQDVYLNANECLALGVGDRFMDKELFISMAEALRGDGSKNIPKKKPKKTKA